MIRLQLLGSIDLRDSEGRELRTVLAQPKRLALLVYLAAASPAGPHRRDTLLGLFWPELDGEHARNALSKAIHFLRRSLGVDALISRSADELAVNPAVIWTDVKAFESALAEGRFDHALELYRGDLLLSFFVPDAPGFEQWLEQERPRLRSGAAGAAKLLAERHEAGRHPTLAVASARRAVQLSNGDERPLRRLIELLDRLGDRAGAVRAYEEFARKLVTELEVEPAAETVALIDRIKTSPLPRPLPRTQSIDALATEPAITRLARAVEGRYKVERQLGAGAMAIVALAHDLRHHRRVAMKVLRPELSSLMGAERFLREIDIAASLMHPHILPVHDSGEADGLLYYVMPYVEGESLRGRLEREGRLPVAEAIQIAREVAGALAYAHRRGFIHRDIKPENILIGSDHALLADFGIARALNPGCGEQWTTTGFGTGTPAYMSPEQLTGGSLVDERADIYALGCVLFEMLTGEPPFAGCTRSDATARHLSEVPPRPSGFRTDLGPDVDVAIARALAPDLQDRFATVADFVAALPGDGHPKRVIEDQLPLLRDPAPRDHHRSVGRRTASAIAILAVVGLMAGQYMKSASTEMMLTSRNRLTHFPGLEVHAALAPAGDQVIFSAGPRWELFIQRVGESHATPIAARIPGPQAWPAWSPDGSRVTFSSPRGLEIVSALDAIPRLLVPLSAEAPKTAAELVSGGWSPNGQEVVFVLGDNMYAVSVESGRRRLITRSPGLHSCTWSLDGSSIACVKGNREGASPGAAFGNLAQSAIVTVPTSGDSIKTLVDDGYANLSPIWLPDRTLLFVSNREGSHDIYAVRLTSAGDLTGSPSRLTTGLNPISIAASMDGRRMTYVGFSESSNIWRVAAPRGGAARFSDARPVTLGSQVIEGFDVSRDGRWLTFASDRDGNSDIYLMPLDGSTGAKQLTRGPPNDYSPAWSPQGGEIAFHSFSAGRRQILLIPFQGGAPSAVTHTSDDDRAPTWTGNGQALVFLTNEGSSDPQLRLTRRAGEKWDAPAPWRRPPCAATESWDGGLIACAEQGGRLILTSQTGQVIRVLVPGRHASSASVFPGWSSDGQTVYYLGADSSHASVYAVPVRGGNPRLVLRFDDPERPWHRYGFRVSQDQLYFTVGDRQGDIWTADLAER